MCSLPKIVTSFPCDAHTKRMINKFSLRRDGTIKTVHSVFGFIFIPICQPTNSEWDPLNAWRRAAVAGNDEKNVQLKLKCMSFCRVRRVTQNNGIALSAWARGANTRSAIKFNQIAIIDHLVLFGWLLWVRPRAHRVREWKPKHIPKNILAKESKLNLFLCFTIFFRCFHSSHIRLNGMEWVPNNQHINGCSDPSSFWCDDTSMCVV